MKIAIINGPNLNLLGKREPSVYGQKSFEDFLAELRARHPAVEIRYYQSNVEGELINEIQKQGFEVDGIIFNPGGYTHTSVALRDAVSAIAAPVIEVHISNVHAREDFRQVSYISGVAKGTIAGLGLQGYELAILHFQQLVATKN
ncbi:MAG: type II 3-dehydroquinate dehydratase [Bacteroidetes bacterium]|nr:type II 3-dehydroquinate dehydratase [Bacteroidota bacterium]